VISNTSATITYNDDETFGSFSSHMENSFPGGIFDNLIFNPVGNVEASGGQSGNSTSLIWLTIKAAPGYALTGVGFSENGSWATGNFGSVGVVAQGGIVDTATGIPLSPEPDPCFKGHRDQRELTRRRQLVDVKQLPCRPERARAE
jgi:hypothetical protein